MHLESAHNAGGIWVCRFESEGIAGLNADILQRFLRMAVSAGFFDVSTADEPLFRNNAASACLRRSHPNALQDTVGLCSWLSLGGIRN